MAAVAKASRSSPLFCKFLAAVTMEAGEASETEKTVPERRKSVFKEHENGLRADSPDVEMMEVLETGPPRDPLNPMPSNDPEDPLNWPMGLKISILIQVCILASLGTINTSIINPAYVPIAKEFGITTVVVSYQNAVNIAVNGIQPFIWIPLANVYGRRPVYLFTTLLGFVSILSCAYTRDYGELLVARVFNGFFPAAMALGATTVVDLFFFHQRGRAMGIFTVAMTNGAHISPIIGGLIGEYCGWRWIFKFAAILDGFMLLTIIFFLPETLYVRDGLTRGPSSTRLTMKQYLKLLRPWSTHPALKLQWRQFVIPTVKMAKYPSVIFPALYLASQYGFASILPAVTVAHIFTKYFHWSTLDIGIGYGAALTIGGSLGELAGGMVVDAMVKRARRRLSNGRDPAPEVRLQAIWTGALLEPCGLLIYGFTLQYRTHWMGPLFGMGLAAFGVQIILTTCYTYSVDCYRDRSPDVSQVFNFMRQEIGMTFAFYAIDWAERIGYQWVFVFFAGVGSVLAFAPIVVLMWRGREIRERFGQPGDAVGGGRPLGEAIDEAK